MTKHFLTMMLAVFLTAVLTVPVFANAAAGPDFTVMITGAPEDMTITLVTPDGAEVEMGPLRRGWESCFRLYYYDIYEAMYPEGQYTPERMKAAEQTTARSMLHVVSGSDGLDFTVPMPEGNQMLYNHLAVMTLDRDGNTAKLGSSAYMPLRNVLLVLIRVSVTLILEGVILHLMGYRSKRSRIVFLSVNLVTQLFLNVTITGNYLAMGYWELGFMVLEGLIFLTEGIAFALLLKEQKPSKGFFTALTANAASLLCGWVMITNLPL